ncbi:hypothetical protein [Runella sp.]|uniref:hypothetical protein n=1 Tax=Runella sp. TaxID=1960881 RepID=UPI003D0BB8A0
MDKKIKHSFKVILEKYISEILVIFIGISISFFFDEWRENRSDEETVKKHLTVLRTNLMQDTLKLSFMINNGNKFVKSINKLAYFKHDSEITDSIDFHIDNAASYLAFKSNQMAYEEIRQTAHTHLIKNDSLKTLFLSYYTSIIPYCIEWCKVDETHTMTQLIPEMSIYFPVVPDSLNLVSSQEKANYLRTKKLRNLLLANAAYKKVTINAFVFTKKATVNLLKKVDDELNTP